MCLIKLGDMAKENLAIITATSSTIYATLV